MTRHALGISYLGKQYHGWQYQTNHPSIQAALEHALSQVAQEDIRVHCAGRTDRGVHAGQQIIHFDSSVIRSSDNWIRGTNANLPADIRVCWHREMPDTFHARFSAYQRRYCYLIKHNTAYDPLWVQNAWIIRHALDELAIQKAASYLVGVHDFSSFRSSQCQANNPIRTMSAISVTNRREWLSIRFEANAFLHHMIRIIVHALVRVGRQEESPDWIQTVLVQKNRQLIDNMAPPVGLYFEGALYPGMFQLPGFVNAIGLDGL